MEKKVKLESSITTGNKCCYN